MKVVVEILDGARSGRRLSFDAPRSLRFGRHPDNDIAFDAKADRDASSRHAELRLVRDGYRLFDLGSANGTQVNGVAVSREGTVIDERVDVMFGQAGPRCRLTVLDEAESSEGAETTTSPFVPPDGDPVAATAARPAPSPRMGPDTVAGIVDQAIIRASASGHRRGLVSAILLVVVGGAAGLGVVLALRGRPNAIKRELSVLVEKQADASDAERTRLQAKIDELTHRLGRGGEIAKENRNAVFLVVSRSATGADGFCTAFAASKRRLLTNAHCVQLAEELSRRGSKIEIVGNGGGEAHPVVHWHKAHGFRASQTHIGVDVGWLETNFDLPRQVRIAPQPVLDALSAGDSMSTYGFPGRLADTMAPEATYVTGVIGRVTSLDGRPGIAKEQTLLQHSAFTSAGTSGSPLFDSDGQVIGINAGGYMDDGTAGRALPGYNFGMRIDLAVALLNEADE